MAAAGIRKEPRERAWFALSVPSRATVFLLIVAFTVRSLDAGVFSPMEMLSADRPALRFGWPCAFAVRTWVFTRPLDAQGRCLLVDAGSINGSAVTVTTISWWTLIGNLVVAVFVLLGAVLAVERTRYASAMRFRFSLRGLFAALAFAGSVTWLYADKSLWNDIYSFCGLILVCALALAWYSFFSAFEHMARFAGIRPRDVQYRDLDGIF